MVTNRTDFFSIFFSVQNILSVFHLNTKNWTIRSILGCHVCRCSCAKLHCTLPICQFSHLYVILDESFFPRIYLFLSWEKCRSSLHPFCLQMSLFVDPISAFIFSFNCFVSACPLFLKSFLRKIVFFGESVVSSSLSSMNPYSQK